MPIVDPKIRPDLPPHNDDALGVTNGGAQPPQAGGGDSYQAAGPSHGILGGLGARLGGLWPKGLFGSAAARGAELAPSDRSRIIKKIVSLIENGQGFANRFGGIQHTQKDVTKLKDALYLMIQHHIDSVTVTFTRDGEAKTEEMSVADVRLDLAHTLEGVHEYKEAIEEFSIAAKMFEAKGDLYKTACALQRIPVLLERCANRLEEDGRPSREIKEVYGKIADAELAFLKIYVLIEDDERLKEGLGALTLGRAFYIKQYAKALGRAGRFEEAASAWGVLAGIYTQYTREFAEAVRSMSQEELQGNLLGFIVANAGDVRDKEDAGKAILERVQIFEDLGRADQIANEMPVIVAILIAWNHSHHGFVAKFITEHPEHKARALKGAALGARVKEAFGCAEIFERELAAHLAKKGGFLEAVRSWRRAVYDRYHDLVHLSEVVGNRQEMRVDLINIKKMIEDMQGYVNALLVTGESDVQSIQGKISELNAFLERKAVIALAWIGEKTLTLAPLVGIESFMGPEESPQGTLAPQMRLISGTIPGLKEDPNAGADRPNEPPDPPPAVSAMQLGSGLTF